jgi:hypothetical protein
MFIAFTGIFVMNDDNVFDEDNALDFIMKEEVEKENQQKSGKGGCLGIIALLIFPVAALYHFVVIF